MKKSFTFLIALISILTGLNAQQTCVINLSANPMLVCAGDSTVFTASGYISGSANYNFDFNNSNIPAGWNVGGGTSFSSPCQPSLDGSPYYWASTAGSGVPFIETADLDVSSGGTLDFEFIYSVQGGASPCEGPDEQDEGISVQYSTDGGGSWIDIIYYSPHGFSLPSNPGGNASISGPTPYTVWNVVSIPIPPGAVTTSTRFRWIQFFSSGTCCDNWGLDNIVISAGAALEYSWSNGVVGYGSNFGSQTFYNLQADTCLMVTVTDTISGISCSDTVCVQVFALPVAILDYPAQICSGQSVLLDGSQSTPGGGISSYQFDLDNNGVYEIQSASSTQTTSYFNTPGNYTFGYQVVTPAGCSEENDYQITVFSNPTINLAANPLAVCKGAPINFLAQGGLVNPPSAPSTLEEFEWSFLGTGIDTTDNPPGNNSSQTYVFAEPGSYNVVVTVNTSANCASSDSIQILVNDLPIADFSATTVCHGDETVLSDSTEIIAPDFIQTWNWTISNSSGFSTNANTQNPSQVFDDPGDYQVVLIVTSGAGCKDTIQGEFTVYPNPVASFQFSTFCFAQNTLVSNSFDGQTPYSFYWDLDNDGDSDTSNLAQLNYIFPDSNDKLVTLLVIDANNCSSDTTILVDVKGGVNDPLMPNVLSHSSPFGNDKIDFTVFAPGYNDCINYTISIYNRWGVKVYEAVNDADNPDLNCNNCFTGHTSSGNKLTPGTYYWVMEGSPNIQPKKGMITIFD